MSAIDLAWQMLWLEWQLGTSLSGRVGDMSLRMAIDEVRGGGFGMRASTKARVATVFADGFPTQPADVVVRGEPGYCDELTRLADAPFGLMVRGDRTLLTANAAERPPRVAIIGSRRPREASLVATDAIAGALARRGVTIVSGLAIGVDGRAHEAALTAGGRTIAVLGSGLDAVHPTSNRALADRIARRGSLLVSEYAPRSGAYPWMFRARNRIIAALADYVVVVQARRASGSMITVRFAQDLGVDVGVVPSGIDDAAFDGSIELLRDGARSIIDARSVERALGLAPATSSELHAFGTMLDVPRTPAELAELIDMSLESVLCELLDLEIAGLVTMRPDGRYANVAGS